MRHLLASRIFVGLGALVILPLLVLLVALPHTHPRAVPAPPPATTTATMLPSTTPLPLPSDTPPPLPTAVGHGDPRRATSRQARSSPVLSTTVR